MLKKQILSFAASALLFTGATLSLGKSAFAQQTIVGYNFDGRDNSATSGTAASTSVFTTILTVPATYTTHTSSTDYALNVTANSSNSAHDGDYIQIQTSTTGFNNLKLSFDTQFTNSGFTTYTLFYGNNVSNLSAFSPTVTPTSTYKNYSFDLSSLSTTNQVNINNQSTAYFRIVFSGAQNGNHPGTNQIDNILLTGSPISTTPAPPGLTSLLLGLSAMGLRTWRRRKADAAMTAADAV